VHMMSGWWSSWSVGRLPARRVGVLTSRVKDRPLVAVKDLDACGQRVDLWWCKRRLVCAEPQCPKGSFTQRSNEVPPRARLTNRLREKIAEAIASANRAVSEVAGEYGVSWLTAHTALIKAAARWLPAPEPTRLLGIDETRARSCGGSSKTRLGRGRTRG